MQVDYLIVGQGIAGTLLSFELLQAGKTVLVMDEGNDLRSSMVAGALINPMAGKHWTLSKEAALFIPHAIATYQHLERLLDVNILMPADLYVFHETEREASTFKEKQEQFSEYIQSLEQEKFQEYFSASFGAGKIKGLYRVDAFTLLSAWEKYLIQRNAFRKIYFDVAKLQLFEDHIIYDNIRAGKILFCEGASAAGNPFFERLPFTHNRGEALLLNIPDLPQDHVYHRRLRLIPKGDGRFWCGSNYIWSADHLLPDEDWKKAAITVLDAWLKLPFSIEEHIVARRPTTAGQFPLIGFHPRHHQIVICNGLGTRGFSSGPYWTHALAQMLTGIRSDMPGYDGDRFRKFF